MDTDSLVRSGTLIVLVAGSFHLGRTLGAKEEKQVFEEHVSGWTEEYKNHVAGVKDRYVLQFFRFPADFVHPQSDGRLIFQQGHVRFEGNIDLSARQFARKVPEACEAALPRM